MKLERSVGTRNGTLATAAEHLLVQREIEKRAHELWKAGGCRQGSTLHDWLVAERDILERFLQTRFAGNGHGRRDGETGARPARPATGRTPVGTQISRKGWSHENHM